jgi:hypothetical protein
MEQELLFCRLKKILKKDLSLPVRFVITMQNWITLAMVVL